VSDSDPAPERRHVPEGKPPQAAQRQSSSYRTFDSRPELRDLLSAAYQQWLAGEPFTL
jgi:hypothetical protein